MARKRPDPERRLRQADRLARLLRLLRLLMGSGRWDAESLAEELGCSRRTVHRMLQCLEMAQIPWHFDNKMQAYRLPPGFKFPGLVEQKEPVLNLKNTPDLRQVKTSVKQLIANTELHLKLLKDFGASLD
ncbi:MAG: HTH domain-containing protein [Pirellulales bacterium]